MDIREATPDDAAAIARVRIDTWRVAYGGLIAPEVLAALDHAEETAHRRRFLESRRPEDGTLNLVAEHGGEIVGWAAMGPTDDPSVGQLYALYVLPAHQGTGAGRALLVAAETAMAAAGASTAVLWHLDGNDRAAGFYERHGWRLDGEEQTDDRLVGGVQAWALHELRRSKALGQSDRANTTAPPRSATGSNPTRG